MQLELLTPSPMEVPKALTLADIGYGIPVYYVVGRRIIMKLKPTGFLLNSSVIGDVINRRDYVVTDLSKGTVYCMKGSCEVKLLKNAKLRYTV